MDKQYFANLTEINSANINGHGVWHYLLDTSIGQIHIVEYEKEGMEIERFNLDCNFDAAKRKFRALCKKLLS